MFIPWKLRSNWQVFRISRPPGVALPSCCKNMRMWTSSYEGQKCIKRCGRRNTQMHGISVERGQGRNWSSTLSPPTCQLEAPFSKR